MSQNVGSLGMNLQHCNYNIYYTNTTSAEDRVQSMGRTNRLGAKRGSVYIDLVYTDTVEEKILQLIKDNEQVNTLFMSDIIGED